MGDFCLGVAGAGLVVVTGGGLIGSEVRMGSGATTYHSIMIIECYSGKYLRLLVSSDRYQWRTWIDLLILATQLMI